MIKSMTGFGIATIADSDSTITVEVRSLNSKFQDFLVRAPRALADFEMEWRNQLSEKLERGKVSLNVEYTKTGKPEIKQSYNSELFKAYHQELSRLADSVSAQVGDQIFQLALNSPEVIQNASREDVTTNEKEKIKKAVALAVAECDQFRKQEGLVLDSKIKLNIETIRQGLQATDKLDPKRVERIRARLTNGIADFLGADKLDQNRLEQEIILYIEKLDINEEKVRLSAHLDYFLEVMSSSDSPGKKLGFIAQEIGREINTIGSKANDAEIQKHVVLMKEELEKIKEQLNNVL